MSTLNRGLKPDQVEEEGTFFLQIGFEDEDGDAVVPTYARARIDDAETAASVRAWTDFSPDASTYRLRIESAENALLQNADKEERIVTIEWDYVAGDGASAHAAREYRYEVVNLENVT